MHSLDRHLASNVCCRKENSFQDRHCIGHDASASRLTVIVGLQCLIFAQKLKQGNIFWEIPMKIQPHGNRKCRFYVPNKNSGERGGGSLRPGGLKGGRPSRPNRGKSASWSFGDRRPCPVLYFQWLKLRERDVSWQNDFCVRSDHCANLL